MNSLEKIVDLANRQNVRGFEKLVTKSITSRIAGKLEQKKKQIAAKLFETISPSTGGKPVKVKMNTRGIGGAIGPSATGDGEIGTIIKTDTKVTPYGTQVIHTIRLNNGQTIQAKDTEFTEIK